jgi:polysaccharide biosynthesis protein PslH
MKILFLSNKVPYPPKDGGSIATLGLMKSLAKLGNEITILAMNTRKHHITPFELPEELTAHIIFHMVEVPAPVSMVGLVKNLAFSKMPYNAQRFIDKNYSKALINLLQHTTYDVIQLEGLYVTPYIPTIRKYSKAPIAYRSHNIEHEIWERTLQNSPVHKKFYLRILTKRMQNFERNALNAYDVLIPITERDGQILNKMGNIKPSLVIPAGIDTIVTAKKHHIEPRNNLFFIGALDWSPNQEGLLWFLEHCWKPILKKRPETILRIAGRNAPKWLIDKLKQPNILYKGEIKDAHDFMDHNGVMIAPLLSGSGMRVKLIEGMMHQKAIVTTPIGCEGIPAKHNVHLSIAHTATEFTHNVLKLLSKRTLAAEMGHQAHEFVIQNYHNEQLALKLQHFYKEIKA